MPKKKTLPKKIQDLFKRPKLRRFYEMVVVLRPFLPEHVRVKIEEKVESLFDKYDVSIKAKAHWGKRVLAYPIKGHKEGYYIIYHIEADADSIAKMRKYIDKNPEILRYLIVKLKEMSLDKLKLFAKQAIVLE